MLLGVTGSGKTFAMAHIIEKLNIPTLIMSHNKTLARQLHRKWSGISRTTLWNILFHITTTISLRPTSPSETCTSTKNSASTSGLNRNVSRRRLACFSPRLRCRLLVSCIYGLNPPETFLEYHLRCHVGQAIETSDLLRELIELQYRRTTSDLKRGECRVRGEVVDIWMPSRDDPLRIVFDFDGIKSIQIAIPSVGMLGHASRRRGFTPRSSS